MKKFKILIVILLIFSSLELAFVAKAKDAPIAKTPSPKRASHWQGAILFGYTANTGNTRNHSFLGQLKLQYNLPHWNNSLVLTKQKTITDDNTTADNWNSRYESQWLYRTRRFFFGNLDYTYNRFNAYTRVANASAGYGWFILDNSKTKFNIQCGPGYQYSQLAAKPDGDVKKQHGITANLSAKFSWNITHNSVFTQEAIVTLNRYNNHLESTVALTTKIIGNLGLEVSYHIEHDTHVLTSSNKANTNTTTNIGLVYTF